MKHEFEKKMHIASDMLSYCHAKGATEFHIDMTDKHGSCVLKITASPVNLTEESLEKLNTRLSAPRNPEIEQDYWALMGESESFSELMLVGMMSDEARAEYNNHELVIKIKRHDL